MAATYLEVSAEEATDDIGRACLLTALHDVAKFRGITEVAEKAGVSPESLSHALSGQADPTLKLFVDIAEAVGMRLALVPIEAPKPAPKKRAAAKKPKAPRKATA